MVSEIRTVMKDFNRDLLLQELQTSPLFVSVQLAGFQRADEFTGTPASRRISRIRQVDGTYVEDIAPAGEVRFEFTSELNASQASTLDALLAAHDSIGRTAEQSRIEQDDTDLDGLIANYPNYDSFTNAQRNSFIKALARVVIRDQRNTAI